MARLETLYDEQDHERDEDHEEQLEQAYLGDHGAPFGYGQSFSRGSYVDTTSMRATGARPLG